MGAVLNSLPWWGSHGAVALDRASPHATSVRAALLAVLKQEIARLAPLSWTVVLTPAEEIHAAAYADVLGPGVRDSRIGQATSLRGVDDLMAIYAKKTRNLVRKSLSQGFEEVVTTEAWAWRFLHETHRQNMAALGGRPKPWSHFEAMRECLPTSRLSLAMDSAGPVAGLLTAQFNGCVEYLVPVVQLAHRPRQPLSFLIFKAMQDALARGAHTWNWGGTWRNQESLHHFKAGFGAQDRPYSYLVGASDAGLSLFRERRQDLADLFPYFYVYPYDALGGG